MPSRMWQVESTQNETIGLWKTHLEDPPNLLFIELFADFSDVIDPD